MENNSQAIPSANTEAIHTESGEAVVPTEDTAGNRAEARDTLTPDANTEPVHGETGETAIPNGGKDAIPAESGDAMAPADSAAPVHAETAAPTRTDLICTDSEETITLNHAKMLLNISKKMASVETLDEMLQTLVDIITKEVDADRGTIFLKDSETNELYSRVARGNYQHEIRILADKGVAGSVFTSGEAANVPDAYEDSRFDHSVDEKTGFKTKSILCVPIRTVKDEIIGVAQLLNKNDDGVFTPEDEAFVDAVTTQAAVVLQGAQIVERMEKARLREKALLDVVADITSEIDLGKILNKVMSQATEMIDSERSTLFLNDEKTNELFSMVGEGLEAISIRLPNNQGIAGTVFTHGKTVNIPYAYSDLRFNPGFDKKTGFFTRSILCVPVNNKEGKTIGVIQLLNKRRGTFTDEDEENLRTFTGQVSIALENAKLFDDVQNMRNRNEGMLQSMSSGVITLNEEGVIETCNAAGLKILRLASEAEILDVRAEDFFVGKNKWILEKVQRVEETQETDEIMDAELEVEIRTPGSSDPPKKENASVNLTVLPLFSTEKKTALIDGEEKTIEKQKKLGSMIMIEDISSEKRMKSTMSRYMDPDLADQLLAEDGEDALGGKDINATVLFSDIRSFTTMTEELGAQGTVAFLNEYFTIMVECIQNEGGMLDKFIGDAIMAAFGVPMAHDDDEDRGVRAAITMLSEMFAWNKTREAEGKKPVDMGVGLNTGRIVTGNIGSPKRMDYTMIGDGVNLASRLESACKQYAARIIISEFTYTKLRGTYTTREIDRVVVKGQTKPVNIYEVLDYHNEETFPNMRQVLTVFKEGVNLYRSRSWDESIEAFNEVLNLNPNDKKLCDMYFERCKTLKANPPGPEWDAVEVKKEK